MADRQRLAAVLGEAAETHHRVYRVSGGADPDWASWYANWLIHLSPLPRLLGRTPINSELVWLLVCLDRQYAIDRPDESWESFYATAILAQLSAGEDEIRIQEYAGDRNELRHLFALAEDSVAELDSYLYDGRILIGKRSDDIIAHLQLVDTDRPEVMEIKNMAVLAVDQGRGVGARLVRAALQLASTEARTTVIVSTATADIGNLRFYQRQGFRFRSVDRDVFTPAAGYPTGSSVDGIPLRDRIWLDQPVQSTP